MNLTGADTVILYDLWWNPAVEEQATNRAHRMGPEKGRAGYSSRRPRYGRGQNV